jgi:hypothetical protein
MCKKEKNIVFQNYTTAGIMCKNKGKFYSGKIRGRVFEVDQFFPTLSSFLRTNQGIEQETMQGCCKGISGHSVSFL